MEPSLSLDSDHVYLGGDARSVEELLGIPGEEILYVGDHMFSDVKISNTLRFKLLSDSKINSANYNVETLDGVVHLTGLARSRAELDRAIGHAQGLKGVKRVVSHVLTKYDSRRVTG